MSSEPLREILVRVVPLAALVMAPFLIGMFQRWRTWRLAVVPEVTRVDENELHCELRAAISLLEPDVERLGFQRVAALRSTPIHVWDEDKMWWEELLYVNPATHESFSVYRNWSQHARFLTECTSGPYVDTHQLVGADCALEVDVLYRQHHSCVGAGLPAGAQRTVPSAETAVTWLQRHLAEFTATSSVLAWHAPPGAPWYRLTFRGAAIATWEDWRAHFRRQQTPSPARGFDVLPRR